MTRSKPISVYIALITVLAISTQTLAETGIPIWQFHDDGSFDLKAGPLSLTGCYPAIDGHSAFAKSVTIRQNPRGGKITYQLTKAELILEFRYDRDSAILSTTLKGLSTAPHWIYPIAQSKVAGADRYFKQGIGFAGPSGVRKIKPPVIRRESRTADETMSFDSYLTFALIAPDDTTLALAAYEHSSFLQRTTFYNRQYRYGLIDRWLDSNRWFIEAGFATENIAIKNAELKLPDLHFVTGPVPFDTLRRLAKNIAKANSVKLDKPTSYHWCSWYDCEKNFSIDKLESFLAGLKTIDPPSPITAIQIDDYCTYGDWLGQNENWPDTVKPAFEKIIAAGYRPGIWVAPFMVDSRSKLYKDHPNWVLHDADGNAVIHWKRPGYDVLALDSSNPGAFEYLRNVFSTLRRWGAAYYKTDFMDWGLVDSTKVKRATPGKTSVQYFVDVADMIRSEIGDESFWLGCISPFAPMVGRVDAVRVANDVHWSWSQGGTGNMFAETFADEYFNNILFANDPDVLYVREYNCELTEDEIYSIALWAGILGGTVNTSDRFNLLAPDRLRLWRFVQPSPQHHIAQLPFFSKPYADQRILVAVRPCPGRNAFAVLFVNHTDKQAAKEYKIRDLTTHSELLAFEWKPAHNKPMDRVSSLKITLKPHASILYYLTADDSPPPRRLVEAPGHP